jgi:hypothetical protein
MSLSGVFCRLQVRGMPQNFVLADKRAARWTYTPSALMPGRRSSASEDGEPFGHPAEAFAAMGTFRDTESLVSPPKRRCQNHFVGGTRRATPDVHDMRLLHDRLGTPVLPYDCISQSTAASRHMRYYSVH